MIIFADPIANGLYFILVAATAALPLLVIVLIVDLTLGRRLAPAYRSLLWTLVAVRMLVPIGLPNTLGVPNLWWAVFEGGSPHKAPDAKRTTPQMADSPPVILATRVIEVTGADPGMPLPRVETSPPPRTADERSLAWEDLIALGILCLWPIGAFIIMGRAVIGSLRFAARLRRIPAVKDAEVNDLIAEICRTMQITRPPRVKYVPDLSAPALFGTLRPTLCLPESENPLSRNELRMVVIHELAHLVRYDGTIAWLLMVVRAVHWFNPLAWFVTRQVAHTRELACDDAVRRFTATTEHRTYGELIVRFAAARPSINLGLMGLWFARPIRRIRSRVDACSTERTSRWRMPRPLSLLVVAVVAYFGFTDRAPSKVVVPPSPLQLPPASPEVVTAAEAALARSLDPRPEGSEVIETRNYKVAQALVKLAAADPEADSLHWLLTHIRPDGEKFPQPALVAADRESGTITLRMSRHEHTGFAQALAGIEQSGPWKIDIEIRFFLLSHLEMLGDIAWENANHVTQPSRSRPEAWPPADSTAGGDASISMESTSTSHGSFLTLLIDDDQMRRVMQNAQRARRNSVLSAPRVTLFNGSGGIVRDESYTPFVTGIARSSDPGTSKVEPVISVLSEGTRLELHATVIDDNALELNCRATFSEIESVRAGRVVGLDHTVQVPKASQIVLQALNCRFSPGKTLFAVPIARLREGNLPVDNLCMALTPRWFPATPPRADVMPYIDETTGNP
jgi:beta-lactamase regulating signal transducer with metallopeptidase domain